MSEKQKAQAERDVLRARLAKVEALAEAWDEKRRPGMIGIARALRAALASVPEPSDSEPTEAEKIVARFDAMTQEEHEAGIAAARERAAERDSEPAPDADREAGEWEGDDLPTPDEAERMGWTV